jgi:hypothetical protein
VSEYRRGNLSQSRYETGGDRAAVYRLRKSGDFDSIEKRAKLLRLRRFVVRDIRGIDLPFRLLTQSIHKCRQQGNPTVVIDFNRAFQFLTETRKKQLTETNELHLDIIKVLALVRADVIQMIVSRID